MHDLLRGLSAVLGVMLCSTMVYAQAGTVQASIAGVVTDSSGGVLPGVSVEASSTALIEKVRTVVTDGTGRYRIIDLPSGTYALTFTLPGFSTVRQEGIALSGSFAATINTQLRVGGLEETITVTSESPIVDVQSARRQQVMDSSLVAAIPSARQFQNLAILVPGLTVTGTQDVGGIDASPTRSFTSHGGANNEGTLQVDGLSTRQQQRRHGVFGARTWRWRRKS